MRIVIIDILLIVASVIIANLIVHFKDADMNKEDKWRWFTIGYGFAVVIVIIEDMAKIALGII